MEAIVDSASEREGQEDLAEEGLEPAAGKKGQITHGEKVNDTAGGLESGMSGLAGGPSVATGMEGQGCLRLDPWRPTHDTTGDIMRFQSEMIKQSERLTVMEKREQRLEQMIESQSLMITSLQQKVEKVADQLDNHPQEAVPAGPSIQRAEALPARAPNPAVQETRGARARLPRAPEPEATCASLPRGGRGLVGASTDARGDTQRADRGMDIQRTYNQGAARRATLKCNKCDHLTTSERRMNTHIRNIHTWTQPNKAPATLLVGDSHTSSIDLREVEQCLGRRARLFMPGAVRPREDRAYCSTPDWTGARYPENSLQQIVPELLGERRYTNLIMLAPTNDISNLRDVGGRQEQERLAAQSAKNTVKIAEKALESVEKVLIMEQPARVDKMADLSEYSRKKLRELVKSCPLAGRIRIGSNRADIVANPEKRSEVFGKPDERKADGIHMRGSGGKKFLTETIKEALQCSGLADKDTRVEKRREAASRMVGQEQGWSRLEGPARPASRMEGQEQGWSRVEGQARPSSQLEEQTTSWADLTSNQFFPLSN